MIQCRWVANLEIENVPVVDKEKDGAAARSAREMPVSSVRRPRCFAHEFATAEVVFGMSRLRSRFPELASMKGILSRESEATLRPCLFDQLKEELELARAGG